MKKMTCIIALAIMGTSTLAFATGTDVSTYTTPKFSASANVKVFATSGDTSFAAESKHLNGTRTYGVTSVDTKVFYKDSNAGDTLSSGPSTSDSTDFQSGWSSL